MTEEIEVPYLETTEVYTTLTLAAYVYNDIEQMIPEEELQSSTVSIPADKLFNIVDLVLAYAERYEDLNVESLLDMADAEKKITALSLSNNNH